MPLPASMVFASSSAASDPSTSASRLLSSSCDRPSCGSHAVPAQPASAPPGGSSSPQALRIAIAPVSRTTVKNWAMNAYTSMRTGPSAPATHFRASGEQVDATECRRRPLWFGHSASGLRRTAIVKPRIADRRIAGSRAPSPIRIPVRYRSRLWPWARLLLTAGFDAISRRNHEIAW